MKCLKCGAELTGTEKFCYDCGSEVVKEESIAALNNVETATEVEIVTPAEQTNSTSQEEVPVAISTEAANVVSQPEVVESNNDVNSEVVSAPTVEEKMADIMEGEPKSRNNKSLIVVALVLLVIVILTGLFMTFKDYFIKGDNSQNDPITEQPKVENKITTLMCNSTGSDKVKSTINITYTNGKATYYDVKYILDVAGLTDKEITSSKAVLEQHVTDVSKFQGNTGFSYSYTIPTVATATDVIETISVLNYTVDVGSVTNDGVYGLFEGMTGTQEEAKTNIQNTGYTCE